MEPVKVSVIIPVYNVEEYVTQCLESVAKQTLKNIEIICVDDRGGDDSMALVERFSRQEPRLRIVRHDFNKGLGAARNTGLAGARGEYVSFIDSDDWIAPTFLERMYSVAVQSRINSVACKLRAFYDDNRPVRNDEKAEAGGKSLVLSSHANHISPSVCTKIFRRSSIQRNGFLFPEGVYFEDAEFSFKFYSIFPEQYSIPDALYMYRQRGDSIFGGLRGEQGVARRCLDMCVVAGNCYRFLVERGKFADLKTAFLLFLDEHIGNFLYRRNFKPIMLPCVKELLPRIGFPHEYEDIRGSEVFRVFDFIQRHDQKTSMRCLHLPLSLCNRLNPHSRLRRRWRRYINLRFL